MIRRLRLFFSSIILTVVLAVLICLVSVLGSLLTIENQGLMQFLDHNVLLYGLARLGGRAEVYWIYALIALIFLFAVNTTVCTLDKVIAILKRGAPRRSLIPHVVHAGFLIALTGHLLGSIAGFRTSANVVFKGEALPISEAPGLSVRLDDFEAHENTYGARDFLRARVSILEKGRQVRQGEIRLNHPLIYRGIAFYYNDDGAAPTGIRVSWKGSERRLLFEDETPPEEGSGLKITGFYPDFARDSTGRPYSRSRRFVNPYVRLEANGSEAFLPIGEQGDGVEIGGAKARFTGFVVSPYVVLAINKDPGIYLVVGGSALLLLGMILLLIYGRDKTELIRPSRFNERAAEGRGT